MASHMVACRIYKEDGTSVGPNTDCFVIMDGNPVALRTDEQGIAQTIIISRDSMEQHLDKGHIIGDAFEFSTNDDILPYNMQSIAAALTARVASASLGDNPSSNMDQLIYNAIKHLSIPIQKDFAKLLRDFKDIISINHTDLGRTQSYTHTIPLRDNEPTFTKQFPLNQEEFKLITDNLKEWIKIGIIEPADSPYNSPIFCVKKKEGQGLRVVLDYRKLNEKTLPSKYSIRAVDECIREVGYHHSKIFTTLDLTSGFWQMPLDEKARDYTAFTVPGQGQFRWRTSPMGLAGCPASFSRLMDVTMRDLSNVITYIDDVLVHSKTWNEHLQHLQGALLRLRKANLKLNLEKCSFGASEVAYLGHTLTPRGIEPGRSKTDSIAKALPPSSTK
jgi:hypothetical protein